MINRRFFLAFILALIMSLTGCGRKYNLAISVEGSGEVAPSPGIHEYLRDTPVPLTVIPATGWGFVGWSGPNGSLVVDRTIIVDGDKYITAVFAKLQHQLDISVEPEGAGTVDVVIVPATRSIEHGQTVRLTAVPGDGYVFDHWEDDAGDTVNPRSFVMDAAKSIKAVFLAQEPTYTLALSVEGEGNISPGAGLHTIDRNTPVTMTATPATGWGFAGWGGPNGSEVSDNTVVMNGNKFITAIFAKLQYELNIVTQPAVAGTVDVAVIPVKSIEHGQTVRLTAVPNAGYVFGCWNDDSGDTVNPKVFVMDAVKNVKATFIAKVADPVLSPGEGTYGAPLNISISSATSGAEIRYTTDGMTTPSATVGTVYAGQPVRIDESTVIKAIACKAGLADSDVVTCGYTLKPTAPTISHASGHYEGLVSVAITAAEGMTIRYTLDGTTPSPKNGILYTGPVSVGKTASLKAVAYSANLSPSNISTRDYIIYRWSSRAPMPTARKGLATAEAGGKIYVIGGFDGISYLNTVEVYDPATNTWDTSKTPMPTARAFLSTVVLNGKIYALGGRTASANWTKIVEIYDPVSDTWESGPEMLQMTGMFTAVVVDEVIYAVGGGISNPGSDTYWCGQQDYDLTTGSWALGLSCPESQIRSYGTAAVGTHIYFFVGLSGLLTGTPRTLIFDTVSQAWLYGANAPFGSMDQAAALINGIIYSFGGLEKTTYNGNTILAKASAYDPALNVWSGVMTMPIARHLHAAVSFGNSAFIFGGASVSGVLSDVTEFEIVM